MVRRSRGFTLAETMLTVALVALVYTLISTILIQISRYVKDGRKVARNRYEMLRTVEELRYQLRSMYYPNGAMGLVGQGSPTDERDTLRFLTTNGKTHKGIVEVGYQINELRDDEEADGGRTALYYREFPFRREDMRTLDTFQEAPWEILLRDVAVFELQYSAGGNVWQQAWDESQSPRRIRVRLKRNHISNDEITFDVTPGVGAGRW